jgi:hypothetical protein
VWNETKYESLTNKINNVNLFCWEIFKRRGLSIGIAGISRAERLSRWIRQNQVRLRGKELREFTIKIQISPFLSEILRFELMSYADQCQLYIESQFARKLRTPQQCITGIDESASTNLH